MITKLGKNGNTQVSLLGHMFYQTSYSSLLGWGPWCEVYFLRVANTLAHLIISIHLCFHLSKTVVDIRLQFNVLGVHGWSFLSSIKMQQVSMIILQPPTHT